MDYRFGKPEDQVTNPVENGGLFSKEMCKKIAKKVMETYDENKDGIIETITAGKMLMDLYRAMNKDFHPTATDIASFARVFDRNRKGKITYEDLQYLSLKYFWNDTVPIQLTLELIICKLIQTHSQYLNILLLSMDINDYEKIKVLGEGTFGKCYLVNNKNTQQLCVIKQIDIKGMTDKEKSDTLREARILEALDHPSIIKFQGSFNSKGGYLNIVMAYADGGDMAKRIKQVKGGLYHFEENQILNWFTQICLALKHVHQRKIIHRDLKCENIFLTKDNLVKLGDFGIAKILRQTMEKMKSVVGTPYYMSPQICDNKDYSFKTDIWSLGVVLYQMCALKPPFDAASLPSLALKICKGEYNPLPAHFSRELKKLVNELLTVDANKRPNINQILRMPLIQSRIINYMPKDQILSDRRIREVIQEEEIKAKKKMVNLMSPQGMSNMVMFPNYTPQYKGSDISFKLKENISSQKDKITNPLDISNGSRKTKREMRRRQISEPNLTPKMFNRIEDTERPNYSQKHKIKQYVSELNLERKKTEKHQQKQLAPIYEEKKVFKMKKKEQKFEEGRVEHKHSDIFQEINQIREIKSSVQGLHIRYENLTGETQRLNNEKSIQDYFKEYPTQELKQILTEDNESQQLLNYKQLQLKRSVSNIMKKYQGKQEQVEFQYQTQSDTLKAIIEDRIGKDKFRRLLQLMRKSFGFPEDQELSFLTKDQREVVGLTSMYYSYIESI